MINLTSSTISGNVATGYTYGINIDNAGVTGCSPIKLSGNIVIGNPNVGVNIVGGFVTAQNNIVSGNGNLGINVFSAQFVEIINNTPLANGTQDLNDADLNCAGTVWSATRSLRLTKVAFIEEAGEGRRDLVGFPGINRLDLGPSQVLALSSPGMQRAREGSSEPPALIAARAALRCPGCLDLQLGSLCLYPWLLESPARVLCSNVPPPGRGVLRLR